jgi:transposase
MSERAPEGKLHPTIWRVPDKLWEKINSIFEEYDPPKRTGRPRVDQRAVLDAVIFRLRTGCQWNRLPKEFPDDSTVHRAFQRWVELGVLDRIWAALIEGCEELGVWTGSGRQPTERWARPVLGGPRRSQSCRPREIRGEAFPLGRGQRRPAFGGDRRGECA